ncbi:M20/M25/M40 family metallo-hydrolase [Paenibacillus campi]|uniref:M20/M25/M40 family metallo-hydrolase n=1 Tax=Paenibacillus campi TaxID=3106031 RepID=UPI002AFE3DB0|nr:MULTISPECIES: M20/M25/M40 family metallo-hydrolase [unclassified Paenibacillus]
MNDDYNVELLKQMLEIPSFSGQEGALAYYLTEHARSLGFETKVDAAGNFIAEKGKKGTPLILLLGHMDTVAPYLNVHESDGVLHGRGAVDAKGSLATFIMAAAAATTESRIVVVGAVEEEVASSKGARYVIEQYHPDVVMIGEPSGFSNIVIGYKGKITLNYHVKSLLTHSANEEDKATMLAIDFWNRLNEHIADSSVSYFNKPTAAATRMDGNMEEFVMDLSLRIPPDYDMEQLKQFIQTIQGDAIIHYSELTPAVLKPRDSLAARALLSSIRSFGLTPKVKVKTGTSDMNIVHEKLPLVPMIAYGPGDSILDHAPNECIVIEEYKAAIQILTTGLENIDAELLQHQENVFSAEDEEEITQRLQALGYID